MKKLMVGFLVLGSINTFAGEAINKKTGDRLNFTVDLAQNQLSMELVSSTQRNATIVSLAEYETYKQNGVDLVKTKKSLTSHCGPCGAADGNPQVLYRESSEAWDVTRDLFNHVGVGYLIPGYNVLLLSVNVMDTVALPINITKKMVRNSYVKKDMKVLNTLLNSDESVEISSKQFNRLFHYLAPQDVK
jgi:hypothetical protein